MIALEDKHVSYIEQQFELMRQTRSSQNTLLLEGHQSMAAIVQAIAVVVDPGAAIELLEALAQNVRDGRPLLDSMHEGFKMRVHVMRDIWHMPGENIT
jgi:hypothetical protein